MNTLLPPFQTLIILYAPMRAFAPRLPLNLNTSTSTGAHFGVGINASRCRRFHADNHPLIQFGEICRSTGQAFHGDITLSAPTE